MTTKDYIKMFLKMVAEDNDRFEAAKFMAACKS